MPLLSGVAASAPCVLCSVRTEHGRDYEPRVETRVEMAGGTSQRRTGRGHGFGETDVPKQENSAKTYWRFAKLVLADTDLVPRTEEGLIIM